ncbi:MAG TPA: hypothetical protein DDW94_08000 [Deltaproteobacteria bacterium]|nr:MAG: hypothetical protein A2Z79_02525 [Deltaproteobacteria bacterium GWA2_55_82]OGQ62687.1 MAG: hypothetical protein A3I81_09345 [Deltaproteobacteria bacterium RIFCSPLOWO2_02_FULL_55_12]OIJ74279.1 MAG: hypothetical protein A2V21_308425 [Deltaproteobacteria bacterium GWC2_55_46]HBG46916.1 hypothetical protein [Deltaproteobacteria bacterium]
MSLNYSGPKFLNGIALLRAIAVLFVMYAHLVGQNQYVILWPKQLLTEYFFEPLNIVQHGGALGVAIFFLVSGYIIPYVAQHETFKEFALKRFFRIYPPFLFSILFIAAAFILLAFLKVKTYGFMSSEHFIPKNIILSASLTNYFFQIKNINSVAWTLAIEILFYVWISLILGVLFKRPPFAILVTFTSSVLLLGSKVLFNFQGELVNCFMFICFMFLGTLIYLRQAGLISRLHLVFWTALFWILFLYHVDLHVVPPAPQYETPGYAASYGLAYLIFVLAVFFEPRIRLGPIFKFISDRSYSIYLFHGTIGVFLIGSLYAIIGIHLTLILAFSAIFLCCHLAYKFVEKPSQVLARKLLGRTDSNSLSRSVVKDV